MFWWYILLHLIFIFSTNSSEQLTATITWFKISCIEKFNIYWALLYDICSIYVILKAGIVFLIFQGHWGLGSLNNLPTFINLEFRHRFLWLQCPSTMQHSISVVVLVEDNELKGSIDPFNCWFMWFWSKEISKYRGNNSKMYGVNYIRKSFSILSKLWFIDYILSQVEKSSKLKTAVDQTSHSFTKGRKRAYRMWIKRREKSGREETKDVPPGSVIKFEVTSTDYFIIVKEETFAQVFLAYYIVIGFHTSHYFHSFQIP